MRDVQRKNGVAELGLTSTLCGPPFASASSAFSSSSTS
jgi:hypothetical protein